MLTSAATLNSTSLAALGVILPTNTSRIRLRQTQPVSLWSSSPQNLFKPRIISTTAAGGSWETETSVKTAVAAVDSSGPAEKLQTSTKYYFVVANAKFMLDEEEHFQEQLFERLRYYGERNKEQDFWLVIEPKFLEKFPKIAGRLKRPAVALVSTNGTWITKSSSSIARLHPLILLRLSSSGSVVCFTLMKCLLCFLIVRIHISVHLVEKKKDALVNLDDIPLALAKRLLVSQFTYLNPLAVFRPWIHGDIREGKRYEDQNKGYLTLF